MKNGDPMLSVKQVIIVRKDLRNKEGHKVRTGKLIAQGAHASMGALLKQYEISPDGSTLTIPLTEPMLSWLTGKFTKITLAANNLEELITIFDKAQAIDGLPTALIEDCGLTEFSEPTITAIAIGPGLSSVIDEITAGLSLF